MRGKTAGKEEKTRDEKGKGKDGNRPDRHGHGGTRCRTAFPNSDGNTGAFFRAENYRREFCVPKTGGLNVEVFALRVNFSEGTCQVKRGLWRNFMEEYGISDVIFKYSL